MHLLAPDKHGRKELEQIKEIVRKNYNSDIVDGIQEVINSSGVIKYDESIATFRKISSISGHSAWIIGQRDKNLLEWKTHPVPENCSTSDIIFIFAISFGNGSVFPQPTGSFELYFNNRKLFRLRVVKSDERWVNYEEKSELLYMVKRLALAPPGLTLSLDEHLREESIASFGYALLKIPVSKLNKGQQQKIKIVPFNENESKRWLRIENSKYKNKEHNLTSIDFSAGISNLFNKNSRKKVDRYFHFFGDIHCHSGEGKKGLGSGCGEGSLDENYQYARDVANLDFFALSCHDFDINGEEDWNFKKQKANQYLNEGRFVTLLSFEWSNKKYGHRTVYYKSGDPPYFDSIEDGKFKNPEEFWQELDKLGQEVITIPHHTASVDNPFCWDYFNPKYDRLVEIYSGNSLSSEYYGCPLMSNFGDRIKGLFVTDALNRGYRTGIIASSDSHDGHPGNSQLDPRHPYMRHFVGSGRVCNVKGTAEIDKITIIKNGKLLFTKKCGKESNEEKLIFFDENSDLQKNNYYYIRVVQRDFEMAWSSPIWTIKKE